MSPSESNATIPMHLPDPEQDGVSHINVYTRGKTRLGRDLSNLSECNINHPILGNFRTLEGLWFYLRTGLKHDYLRATNGYDSRRRGKLEETILYSPFNKMFKLGMIAKIEGNSELAMQLVKNELPLMHYYNFHGTIHVPGRHEWQLEFWKTIQINLQSVGHLDIVREELLESVQRAAGKLENKDE